jgi:bifunctional DNA-binding transcriptional regulator/antitoxin component of YhaV-PrlF toxin-antitoxin module
MPRIVDDANVVYRAKVTGRHAITLPSELCRQLEIGTGDSVEIRLIGDQAFLRRVVDDEPIPPARGLLRDYFRDWEDINRFVQEERQGWDDREKLLDQLMNDSDEQPSSSTDS